MRVMSLAMSNLPKVLNLTERGARGKTIMSLAITYHIAVGRMEREIIRQEGKRERVAREYGGVSHVYAYAALWGQTTLSLSLYARANRKTAKLEI